MGHCLHTAWGRIPGAHIKAKCVHKCWVYGCPGPLTPGTTFHKTRNLT